MTRGGLRPLRTLILLVPLVTFPSPATADWQFTPFVGWTFKGATTLALIEPGSEGLAHWNLGGAVTVIGRGPLGAEGYFVLTPGIFSGRPLSVVTTPGLGPAVDTSRSYAFMGNVVLAAPLSWNEYGLRPFVSGGLGMLHATQVDEGDALTFKRNIAAYNVGGGAVGFLSNRTGLRFDLRYFRNLKNEEDPLALDPDTITRTLHYWTAAIGVVIKY